jgi:hypothetical protein
MKAFTKFFAVSVLLTIFYTINPTQVKAQDAPVNFQVFYDDLSPYGQWIDYQGYGYAWVPSAGPDFAPYSTGGHWIWTDYGWTWASDYDWGWAPFHYGRWDYDNYYGWVWIPDNQWGPAWVSWRRSAGYYGWTPLSPGISFNMAIGNYNPTADRWIFLQDRYMGQNDIHNYYGPRKNNQTYINNSTVINNTYVDNNRHTTYISGPRREDVQKVTGNEIKPVSIRENSTPGQRLNNTELNIYRPQISKGNANDRPAKITDKKDINPRGERNDLNKNNSPANGNNNDRPVNQIRQQAPQQQQVQQPQPQQRTQPIQQPIQQLPQQQRTPPVKQTRQARQLVAQQQKTQPVKQPRQPRQQVLQQQNQQPVQQRLQQIRQQPQQQPRPQRQQQPRQQMPQQQKTQPV